MIEATDKTKSTAYIAVLFIDISFIKRSFDLYSNVRFCALPCRSQWYTTRTPLVAVIVLFYVHALVQARWWA